MTVNYVDRWFPAIFLIKKWWKFIFPEYGFQTFNEIQKLLCKTNGKVVGDLMTSSPLAVRETSNLEDAAR